MNRVLHNSQSSFFRDYLEIDDLTLYFCGRERFICKLSFQPVNLNFEYKRLDIIRVELGEYFSGIRKEFSLIPMIDGYTVFRQKVWNTLLSIPYGRTFSYGDIAYKIGKPNAYRAVGQAVGSNPIPIIIPCHRVIRTDRTIGGFSSGLNIKRKLLDLESQREKIVTIS